MLAWEVEATVAEAREVIAVGHSDIQEHAQVWELTGKSIHLMRGRVCVCVRERESLCVCVRLIERGTRGDRGLIRRHPRARASSPQRLLLRRPLIIETSVYY